MALVKLISTPAALVLIGLIWLSSASSAEAAKIVFLEDDSCEEPQEINWVLSPLGIGAINIRLDLVSTNECEEIDGGSSIPGAGGYGGGGGGIPGGFVGGQSPGSITPPNAEMGSVSRAFT